ncbi:AAEL000361-PA [Aedes aegypti]|uniref:AAEL000361-PA n=1 Tax=Aedes aegypti TaxID=7159 RepID=Q17PL0_AEDAE|nr:AAEL000361-PA [Aedes aegypti]
MKLVAIVVLAVIGVISADSLQTCAEYEVYSECASACPVTCDTLGEDKPCDYPCIRGCFCQPGYVRNTATGECVRECDCPPKTTTPTTTMTPDTTYT